jgi:hypothetical protein
VTEVIELAGAKCSLGVAAPCELREAVEVALDTRMGRKVGTLRDDAQPIPGLWPPSIDTEQEALPLVWVDETAGDAHGGALSSPVSADESDDFSHANPEGEAPKHGNTAGPGLVDVAKLQG